MAKYGTENREKSQMSELNSILRRMAKLLEIYPWLTIPESELQFRFTRSSGPGGQNVNKVATRVELTFDVAHTPSLDDRKRDRLQNRLAGMVDGKGVLRLASQESRSQWKNRVDVVAKFVELLRKALAPQQRRISTRPTSGSRQARVKQKRARSATKVLRRRASIED
jgi:ribosome-associated protein